jgi:hypothetical protein
MPHSFDKMFIICYVKIKPTFQIKSEIHFSVKIFQLVKYSYFFLFDGFELCLSIS